jgi:DNA-binding response OmpR family regulator
MLTILLIDDQPHLQELLSLELSDEGYGVVSMSDSKSAMAFLRNSKPDLVLLDLYLDGFEGFDLLRDIKAKHPELPVLIVTAYDSYVDDPRLSQCDGYIIKAFTALDDMKEKIGKVLKCHAAYKWRGYNQNHCAG